MSNCLIATPYRQQEGFLPPDIVDPKFRDLVDLALLRVFDAASFLNTRPPRLFPTIETGFAKYFAHDDWLAHGDLKSEMARVSYMLSNLPERGIPTAYVVPIRFAFSSASVLSAWERTLPRLKINIAEEIRRVMYMMQKEQRLNVPSCQKSRFIAVPVDYRTDANASGYAIQLCETSLSEIVAQVYKGRFEQAKALQIFAFLKDPLGGLEGVFDKAVDLFAYMMTFLGSSARQTPGKSLTRVRWQAAAVQAAQEAFFLACPLLEHINYIHFTGHQQLPYVYVALDQLPRSEFSIPEHVLRIVEEILTTESFENEGSSSIAPISVSYSALPLEQGEHMTVIIDGNNRATATMLLRLVAECPAILTINEPGAVLDAFCTDHGLGLKWKVDLSELLEALRGNRYVAFLCGKMDFVERFRDVHTIPALVVREDHFHTACQQRAALGNRPRLLLPIHQALYNDERLGFAFPQAGQVHGRASVERIKLEKDTNSLITARDQVEVDETEGVRPGGVKATIHYHLRPLTQTELLDLVNDTLHSIGGVCGINLPSEAVDVLIDCE
ncbi:MAG: hypothetical protein Q9166_004323 [cf. Caloplaca sp. 2 TL-2023]